MRLHIISSISNMLCGGSLELSWHSFGLKLCFRIKCFQNATRNTVELLKLIRSTYKLSKFNLSRIFKHEYTRDYITKVEETSGAVSTYHTVNWRNFISFTLFNILHLEFDLHDFFWRGQSFNFQVKYLGCSSNSRAFN